MGNAYKKSDDYDKAKWAYEKALTEHRTPEYKTSLSEVSCVAYLLEFMISKCVLL